MMNEIAALDRPPPRLRVSHLIGPGIDGTAAIQPHLDGHAAESVAGLCRAFIVIELGKQPPGLLDREHLADDVRPCLWIELGSRIPAEIV
jgi:hypothetical protein